MVVQVKLRESSLERAHEVGVVLGDRTGRAGVVEIPNMEELTQGSLRANVTFGGPRQGGFGGHCKAAQDGLRSS